MKHICIVAIVALFAACNTNQGSQGHTHDTVGEHTDDEIHAHEAEAISYTLFSENYELFVEFSPLSVGQTSSFAAHVTELDTYKPVSQGSFTVSLIRGNKGIRQTVDKPSAPGIFRPSLQPKEAGDYQMLFRYEDEAGNVTFDIPNIQVYADASESAHALPGSEDEGVITFLKEQAWKTEFNTMAINPQPFHAVIHTSGKVNVPPQSEVTLNAQIAGSVQLLAILGETVNKGDLLALLTGSGIDNNMSLRLSESKITFEKSKSDFLRSIPLMENQLISKKDFLDVEASYQQDSLRYHQLAQLVSKNGLRIVAPTTGFITRISVDNGQFIEAGKPLITVTNQNQLLIEALVNQSDIQRVEGIFDANFKFAGENTTVSLQELNGRLTTKNAFVNESYSRIPVVFSVINNGQLMPGMFLETFLLTGQKENALVVPLTAIIEEHGLYYVFVQTGGESFVKREVRIADNDGAQVHVVSGLAPGERVVTKGAYQVKLAEMAGELPLHGHTH